MEPLEQVKKTVVEKAKEARDAAAGALSDAKDAAQGALRDARGALGEIIERVVAKVRGRAGGGDLLAILREDAEVLRAYLGELEAQGQSAAVREGLFSQLVYELEQNAALKEERFFPLLKGAELPDEAQRALQGAVDAYALMREHIGKLTGEAAGGKEWRADLTVLKENLLHRLAEEEAQLFPVVQARVPAAELRALGERIREQRQAGAQAKAGAAGQAADAGRDAGPG